MYEKNVKQRLISWGIREEIAEAGKRAYEYLSDPKKCLNGAEYAEEIADAVFGQPTMAWSKTRTQTQHALEILANRGFVEQGRANGMYRIVSPEE